TTTENNQFALALAFSMDEVNRNPDLLPNISLAFEFAEGGCKTVLHLYNILHFSEKSQNTHPNYMCSEENTCIIVLTGPDWATSAMVGRVLNIYNTPQ
ncbi:vomeronasal type-2 receptor 116-like, partial [Sigmodon hispidus]